MIGFLIIGLMIFVLFKFLNYVAVLSNLKDKDASLVKQMRPEDRFVREKKTQTSKPLVLLVGLFLMVGMGLCTVAVFNSSKPRDAECASCQ
jgi:hypothetical protein